MLQQKKIAIINDISGLGRCSITVALPILSAMKIHCGIVPTAILSNQTEYPEYTFYDFTKHMDNYINTWKSLNFSFDGLYTGFLGSAEQIAIINRMIEDFSFQHIIIDPVMGDHGKLYDSYDKALCEAMKKLVCSATLITPNLTELCILTDSPYSENISDDEIKNMCIKLCKPKQKNIIVTGIEREDAIYNIIYENEAFSSVASKKILPVRPGTGDVFASIVAGSCLHNTDLTTATKQASSFIEACLSTSAEMNIPINDGVCFEEHLQMLIPKE